MKRDAIKTILEGPHGAVRIERLEHGFPSITAREELDLFYGLGYAHGRDRQMHMWLMKLAGQDRASECLKADDELVEADRFMRWLDFAGEAAEEAQHRPRRCWRPTVGGSTTPWRLRDARSSSSSSATPRRRGPRPMSCSSPS